MSADDDRLASIEQRLAAATPGNWAIWHDLDHQGFKTVGDADSYQEVLDGGVTDECNPVAHVYVDSDADLVAHAPDDLRWLIDLVKQLADDLDEVSTDARVLDTTACEYRERMLNARMERDRLAEALARVEKLADEWDDSPNWREWGIGSRLRAALRGGDDDA